MNNKFCIIDSPFEDWSPLIKQNKKIRFFKYSDIFKHSKLKLELCKYKIISISVDNYKMFNNCKNNIFINNLDNINLLNNKSKFGEYMLINYKNNYAETYYYNYNNIVFINKPSDNENNFIVKPNIGCGGNDIKIINKIDYNNLPKNSIINKYIEHNTYYAGHFLILNGKIIDKVYFYDTNNDKNFIKKGKIINYKVTEKLLGTVDAVNTGSSTVDETIFDNIFDNLKYSGFACIDFIINNNNIIIFEINPRPGGSLIYNTEYFNKFIDTLLLNYY